MPPSGEAGASASSLRGLIRAILRLKKIQTLSIHRAKPSSKLGHKPTESFLSTTTMPPAKKRKIADDSKVQDGAPVDGAAVPKSQDSQQIDKESEIEPSRDTQPDLESVDKNQERKERFKALQARAVSFLRPTYAKVAEH